jgi:hypothetical protein
MRPSIRWSPLGTVHVGAMMGTWYEIRNGERLLIRYKPHQQGRAERAFRRLKAYYTEATLVTVERRDHTRLDPKVRALAIELHLEGKTPKEIELTLKLSRGYATRLIAKWYYDNRPNGQTIICPLATIDSPSI